ncbi:unnamed protein product [Calypogeia fissa]
MLLQREAATLKKVYKPSELVETNIVEEQVQAIVPLRRDATHSSSTGQQKIGSSSAGKTSSSHTQDRCFDLHPELRAKLVEDRQHHRSNNGKGKQQQGGYGGGQQPSKAKVKVNV